MDRTSSAYAVARELGTSVPRVVRAARRLGLAARTDAGGLALARSDVEQLRAHLGASVSLPDLSRAQTAALAALATAPLGVPSARALAGRAGLSPTAASEAVRALIGQGLATRKRTLVASGRARSVEMIHVERHHPRYRELARTLRRVRAPRPPPEPVVPGRLRHLFWNTAPAQLEVAHGGAYLARRLLRTLDPDGLAWGARHLRPEYWRAGARARGLTPAVKALAENLAAAREADEVTAQRRLEQGDVIEGIRVAGLKDLMAMKLRALAGRGELRDYYDVMRIDEHGGVSVEDGVALYLERYGLDRASAALRHLVLAMGYLDDADEDEALPVEKGELSAWWRRRQAQVVANL